jgi:hypothetical protein
MIAQAGCAVNRAYSSFEHLVLNVCSDRDKGWRFVMFDAQTVYLDDSGTDSKSRIAAAAFCVSTVDKWQDFLSDWQKVAKTAGFKLAQFHMTEFAACRRDHMCNQCRSGQTSVKDHPWRLWSHKKRKSVLTRLAKALVKNVQCGWGMAHTKQDYEKHVRDSPARALSNVPIGDEHFTFAVQQCGGHFAEWRASNRRTDKLKFVFDIASQREKREIANVFFAGFNGSPQIVNGLERWFDPELGVSFESRKITHQLLAADMVAWTSATIRARMLTLTGRYVEVFQVAKVFANSEHVKIGFLDQKAFSDWEKKGLG